jgi:hypothetical protein
MRPAYNGVIRVQFSAFLLSVRINNHRYFRTLMKTRTWTDYDLKQSIIKCKSFSEVAYNLNLSRSTNSALKKRAIELNLDTSHFRVSGYEPALLKEILINGTKIPESHKLKLRLISEGYKEHKCEICGITEWNGEPTPIELDHIDGNRYNNTINNLRILCPNCHAQTDTYRGKNKNKQA